MVNEIAEFMVWMDGLRLVDDHSKMGLLRQDKGLTVYGYQSVKSLTDRSLRVQLEINFDIVF